MRFRIQVLDAKMVKASVELSPTVYQRRGAEALNFR